jgi:hypothetical protein
MRLRKSAPQRSPNLGKLGKSTHQEDPNRGKEQLAMKRLTVFAVITLFVLGCSTAFGQVNLGFLSSDMSIQYCDFESLEFGGFLAAGIHVNAACGTPDGSMLGFKDTLVASNLPLTGTVYALGDSTIDAYCDCFSGDQALWITQTQAYNIHSPHIGWEVLFNTYDAFYAYLDNYGLLTNTLPLAAQAKGKSGVSSIGTLHLDHNVLK